MANEVRVQSSLTIKGGNAGNLSYQSQPTSYNGNISAGDGPTPGVVTASQSGTVVNISAVGTPGYCRMMNLDASNNVEVGVYDPDTNEFYPLLEFPPGLSLVLYLSQFLGSEFGTAGTGTGTSGSGVQLMVKGVGGTCLFIVEAFTR